MIAIEEQDGATVLFSLSTGHYSSTPFFTPSSYIWHQEPVLSLFIYF